VVEAVLVKVNKNPESSQEMVIAFHELELIVSALVRVQHHVDHACFDLLQMLFLKSFILCAVPDNIQHVTRTLIRSNLRSLFVHAC